MSYTITEKDKKEVTKWLSVALIFGIASLVLSVYFVVGAGIIVSLFLIAHCVIWLTLSHRATVVEEYEW